MKSSRRSRRMARHHSRLSKKGGFNMVSLMDVFTILVFFLLVNTGNPQPLPDPDNLKLPASTAETKADQSTVIMLTRNAIRVNGDTVTSLEHARSTENDQLPKLAQALAVPEQRQPEAPENKNAALNNRGKLTIMADKGLSYRLIRKVMLTGTASGFSRISLAVLQNKQQ